MYSSASKVYIDYPRHVGPVVWYADLNIVGVASWLTVEEEEAALDELQARWRAGLEGSTAAA